MPYKKFDKFITPKDSTTIFKFMDLAKFISLITNQKLFFARLSVFNDPWEGFFLDYYKDKSNVKLFKDKTKFINVNSKNSNKLIKDKLINDFAFAREHFAASCWFENERDNEAFWKLYADVEYGLALKSSIGRLKKALNKERFRNVYITKVNYIDINNLKQPIKNFYEAVLLKRIEYQYENEIRALIWEYEKYDNKPHIRKFENINGSLVGIDIKTLISEIIISPLSPDWFCDTIIELLKKLKLDIKVKKSTLFLTPSINRITD